jgi:hypothetical protein
VEFYSLKYPDMKIFDERQMIAEISPSNLAQELLREVHRILLN